jgi:hypothetical protein
VLVSTTPSASPVEFVISFIQCCRGNGPI